MKEPDIFQQCTERFAGSSSERDRHLLATAAEMHSFISNRSLPLSTISYFNATISSLKNLESADSNASTATISFLGIVLQQEELTAVMASEAMEVLVGFVESLGDKLPIVTMRAALECILIILPNMKDWVSMKPGFHLLLKLSSNKKSKVRRRAQHILEKFFQSVQSRSIITEASNSVLVNLRSYLSLADKLITSQIVSGFKDETPSKPEHLEVLHMLNMLKLIVPSMHAKVKPNLLLELHKIMPPQFSPFTRHILKLIEVFLETSRVDIMPQVGSIMDILASYISLKETKTNPVDTVISAANLFENALDSLDAGECSKGIKNLPRVCESVAGLLSSEPSTASEASSILKALINNCIAKETFSVDKDQPHEAESESLRTRAIKSTCAVLENLVNASDEIPNEHLLAVISTLFTKLGTIPCNYMEGILDRLAALMTSGGGDTSNKELLQNCIGSAVTAMGPKMVLQRVPITLNTAGDLTSSNIWLVAILKKHVVGASLGFYIDHIDPLANSFYQEIHKVEKKQVTGEDLQAHAHSLWGLLPAFCQYPTDCYENFERLVDLLLTYLKKYTFMHGNVAVALQILVNQNKSARGSEDVGEGKMNEVNGSMVEHGTSYSKEIADKNIKALSLHSAKLLQALTDLFFDANPGEQRALLKGAIGSLASITDSSVTQSIFKSLFGNSEPEEWENQTDESIDKEQSDSCTSEKEMKRYAMIGLASFFVEGATADHVELIFNFLKQTLKSSKEIGHCDAYHTLNKILEVHTWFCSSRSAEVINLLLDLKSPVDAVSLRSRLACFHILLVHVLEMEFEAEENTQFFRILEEIILTIVNGSALTRDVVYDGLFAIGSSLKNSSIDLYHKLINNISDYLHGAPTRMKKGAMSALSVLVHNDPGICFSMPTLVPPILSYLQGVDEEIVKGAISFVKVLVLCLPTKDLQKFLPDIVNGVLPLYNVSRDIYSFRVRIILGHVLRKCGTTTVKQVITTPERYDDLIKSIVERWKIEDSKEVETIDMELTDTPSERSCENSRRSGKRKRAESGRE